jgi:hypothetical protein
MANPDASVASIPYGDLFGSESVINEALGTGFALNAFADFLNNAFIDLFSYQYL